MSSNNTCKSISVSNCNLLVTVLSCLFNQFLRVRCTPKKGEVCGYFKFGVSCLLLHVISMVSLLILPSTSGKEPMQKPLVCFVVIMSGAKQPVPAALFVL